MDDRQYRTLILRERKYKRKSLWSCWFSVCKEAITGNLPNLTRWGDRDQSLGRPMWLEVVEHSVRNERATWKTCSISWHMFGLMVNCTFIGKDTTRLVNEQPQSGKKLRGSWEVKNPESSHVWVLTSRSRALTDSMGHLVWSSEYRVFQLWSILPFRDYLETILIITI